MVHLTKNLCSFPHSPRIKSMHTWLKCIHVSKFESDLSMSIYFTKNKIHILLRSTMFFVWNLTKKYTLVSFQHQKLFLSYLTFFLHHILFWLPRGNFFERINRREFQYFSFKLEFPFLTCFYFHNDLRFIFSITVREKMVSFWGQGVYSTHCSHIIFYLAAFSKTENVRGS